MSFNTNKHKGISVSLLWFLPLDRNELTDPHTENMQTSSFVHMSFSNFGGQDFMFQSNYKGSCKKSLWRLVCPYLVVCIFVLLHRSTVLCWAWHHDHQIGWGVLVSDGGVRPHRGLPLFLDHYNGAEALLLRHHHSELRRIRIQSFLPWLYSSPCCYQVSVGCGHK